MSKGKEEEEGGGNEVHLGLPCGRQKVKCPKEKKKKEEEETKYTLAFHAEGKNVDVVICKIYQTSMF